MLKTEYIVQTKNPPPIGGGLNCFVLCSAADSARCDKIIFANYCAYANILLGGAGVYVLVIADVDADMAYLARARTEEYQVSDLKVVGTHSLAVVIVDALRSPLGIDTALPEHIPYKA